MTLYLHTNGVNRFVIQTLHRMGVCANYDISMEAMKNLSAKATVSSNSNLLGYAPPSIPSNHTKGIAGKQADKNTSNKDQCTSRVIPGQIGPRKPSVEATASSVNRHPTSPPHPDERALNQQLGVQCTTTQPPAPEPYSKRPKWRVTQSPGFHVFTQPTGPPDERPKATAEESTAFRSALLTSAATTKGYGLLIPPKRSTPSIYHNKASNAVFRVNDQRPRIMPVPLPPLPPAMTNPLLPPDASPQQKLQYAMIMHNHSILNQGKG